jgi:hypothetical protein
MAVTTFLTICQRVARECGIPGTGPTTVTGQTDELLNVVSNVQAAWESIQNRHRSWDFFWRSWSFDTVADTDSYALTVGSETVAKVFAPLQSYLKATGESAENLVNEMTWEDYRNTTGTRSTGNPSKFCIRPDKKLILQPTPDDVYTITGDVQVTNQILSVDADEPLCDVDCRMAIVWKAVMNYAGYEEAGALYQFSEIKYRDAMSAMRARHLPSMVDSRSPLA